MEILAPAGGPEALRAAVLSGADAVYLGLSAFSARSGAENFTPETLAEATRFCHARGVKVHVALNTLVKDSELPALYEQLAAACAAGADALIVQDLAVARLARTLAPQMPLHASTQLAIHDPAGVRLMRELGFSRVVLARELSFSEIKTILDSTDLEVEVFIHGALCMCVSGMCTLSSILGGRSGNRGRCAQPCRLPFVCEGRENALSLKDLSAIRDFRKFEEMGVASVKIEGRMKRPEYVAAACRACVQARAGEEPDLATLRAVFSRSGFTEGYLEGRRDLSLFGVRTKEDVTAAPAALPALHESLRREQPRFPLDLELDLPGGTLKLIDEDRSVSLPVSAQPAQTAPLSEERARAALAKTGGTPYFLRSFSFRPASLHLSAGELSALRREGIEQLLEKRQRPPVPIAPFPKEKILPKNHEKPLVRLQFSRVEQLCETDRAERILLPAEELLRHPECAEALGDRLIAVLPALSWDDGKTAELLHGLRAVGVESVLCENAGPLQLAREQGFRLHGGASLNLFNTPALLEAERLGLEDVTMSFELSAACLAALGGSLPRGALVYGRLPLMRLRACPKNHCSGCKGRSVLTDRKGMRFPLVCHEKQYTTLLNALPLCATDKAPLPVDFVTLSFTTESPDEIRALLPRLLSGAPIGGAHTNGLLYREVL